MSSEDEKQLFETLKVAGVPQADALKTFFDLRKHEISTLQERELEEKKLRRNTDLEMYNALATNGRDAIKAGMITNGAAALGVLTFVGHLATQTNLRITISQMALPEGCFAVGVLLAGICYGTVYAGQRKYRQVEWNRYAAQEAGVEYDSKKDADRIKADRMNKVAVGLGFGTLSCFAIGCLIVFCVFFEQ